MTNLLDLAAKVEAAEGPDAALGLEISIACGMETPHLCPTASIDAAMMLVPAGWNVELHIYPRGEQLCVLTDQAWEDELPEGRMEVSDAATPALALTAASLRARSENPA